MQNSLKNPCQSGLTLIELMVAMTLGMGITLAAIALMVAAKSSYLHTAELTVVQDSGRYAIDVISRSVRQANYLPYDHPRFSTINPAKLSPGIIGLDNRQLAASTPDISAPVSNAANHGSDVLAVRFFGSGKNGHGDGSVLNCAGFSVPEPTHVTTMNNANDDRRWSIWYVAQDGTGEPELRCKFLSHRGTWSSQAIVRGVESFQVLYGVRDNAGAMRYLNAERMSAADWSRVTVVKVALLVRGEGSTGDIDKTTRFTLFGSSYQNANDLGTTIELAKLTPSVQQRLHKVFQTSIQLRNRADPIGGSLSP